MGNRYLVTGAQLGLIISLSKFNARDELMEVINTIIDDQHLWVSENDVIEDAKSIQKMIEFFGDINEMMNRVRDNGIRDDGITEVSES